MKAKLLGQVKAWPLVILFIFVGVMEARADIRLGDNLTMTGFVRYELGVHTASRNPNNDQDDNNSINLSRTFFQTEWTYMPSDALKVFAKARLIHDSTEQLDSELNDYDAFPLSTPRYGTHLRANNDDDFAAELWELYADVELGDLWLRMGKQQIVWGEMIGTRIMDIINPLDMSWNLLFEPEEFENIRIPQWSVRAIYNVEQSVIPWLMDISLEGFVNPGDISPTVYPDYGAPFNLFPQFPPFLGINDKDRRGDEELGIRVGARIGNFYGTLNYLHLFTDDYLLDYTGVSFGGPFGFMINMDAEYPTVEVFGFTLNYASPSPLNTVVTLEGTYTPDQPYQDAKAPVMMGDPIARIRDEGAFNWAIRFDRNTFFLPRPTSAMRVQLQFSQTIVKDHEDVLGPNNSKIDKTTDTIVLMLAQPLRHDTLEPSLQVVYDLDDAYLIKPAVRYRYGNRWYFDIFGVFVGGAEDRPGRFGAMDWADEVVGRATFQF